MCGFSTPTASSPNLCGHQLIVVHNLSSDTGYMELAQTPQIKGLFPQDWPSSSSQVLHAQGTQAFVQLGNKLGLP